MVKYIEFKNIYILFSNLPEAEVRNLCADKNEESFIADTWKYSKPLSIEDFRQNIRANPSSGVFVNGKCVAGALIPGYGLISSLFTLKEYRNKGYGRLAMEFLFQECAKQGLVPAFTVECRNSRSIKFNEGLGVKLISVIDWVEVRKFAI